MTHLPLRLRVFLFFCLIAAGGVGVIGLALWLGHRQLGAPEALSAFVTAGLVAGLGVLALTVFVWLLFDENVAKPIERLAASLRLRAHADGGDVDEAIAPYLGDLAPAARAVHDRLSAITSDASETVAQETDRLRRQRAQLLQVLSDIPLAILVLTRDHRIALYDGQAADLMAEEAPARLDGSLFDYLDEATVRAALDAMDERRTARQAIAVTGRSGRLYSGHIRRFPDDMGYTLMLEPLSPDAARPPTFDLDLFVRETSPDLDATPLRHLAFVVFDSETTGLDTERDAVVQLGAIRVVCGRLIEGERLETLVDPGRPIPIHSTKVHGIDDAAVAGAPAFPDVCRRFHDFAHGAVIVAHNAPFDMAFLHRAGPEVGVAFDHPVLDTVHLSAIVFGGSEAHTLDALCQRLCIEIPPELRHTAMGDAVATAEVLVALIPVLEGRGLSTFGQVRAEARKHQRILKDASAG
jgi:DNA polymerase-3 subunit epsilon